MKGHAERLVKAIASVYSRVGRPVRLMEVCGTHTVAIFRHGIRGLLPEGISLLSGPGCPVCVTSTSDIDRAVALARTPGAALATFGDMMRVPGGGGSLYEAKAEGADVRVVYSPLDALRMAASEKDRKVVFFGAGFETTTPLVAATLAEADRQGVGNFYLFPVHKLVPPALRALLDSPEVRLDGLILPGHVSAIIGVGPYGFIGRQYGVPSVITGFGAEDILEGILMLLEQIRSGRPGVEVQYARAVREEGNPRALKLMEEYFVPADQNWRGVGVIPRSGLVLREKYLGRDFRQVADPRVAEAPEPRGCSCGEVLRGLKVPTECPLFGRRCTPERPVGACMVSAEGSCAAYYRYGGGAGG
ncbi:MAG: hydrogenase formation protein HypD [Thermodesulfovibrionales bacterium]